MRDSSCLSMIPSLVKKGAKINYFDPTGKKNDFNKIKFDEASTVSSGLNNSFSKRIFSSIRKRAQNKLDTITK